VKVGLHDRRSISFAGWAAFGVLGWAGLLVPSLIRSVERDFGQSDAGMGTFYLVFAAAYALGSLVGGVATERIGRRTVLVGSLLLQAGGLAVQGLVPDWFVFVVAGIPRGVGGGAIDGGVQGLFLDAFADAPSRAMNLLHLAFSAGALAAPICLAQLVEAGMSWQALTVATAVASLAVALPYARISMPSGRHRRDQTKAGVRIGLPLIVIAVAIAAYVGAEVGVSSWLVRYLAAASLPVATGALSLFWAGLTLGRLVAARVGDRFGPVELAVASSVAAAVAIVAAVAVPSLPIAIGLFGVVGFAFGPVYPTIMLIGDRLYPGRAAAVSGLLAGVAVAGAVGYPPLMGAISVGAGLGVGLVGAAALSAACAVLLVVGVRAARRSWREEGSGVEA